MNRKRKSFIVAAALMIGVTGTVYAKQHSDASREQQLKLDLQQFQTHTSQAS